MLRELGDVVQARFDEHLRALDPEAPPHRVEFSRRITESWALIYYRRHLVRLSPYLFLLEPDELKHGTHWQELDATLRHEAAHAATYHQCGETGHTPRFHGAMAKLGLDPNGRCDLGPENAAFRYVYGCPVCENSWHRRARLRGNWSCGLCAPGRFSPEHRLELREVRDLASRLAARGCWMHQALAEGLAAAHPAPAPRLVAPLAAAALVAPLR
jgi:predicted SprT family Zn-dependent metalloprotease